MKNGRIDISGKYENNKVSLFSEKTDGIEEYNTHSIAHTYEGTKTQYAFFSKINIEHLQKLLKYHVWIQSDKKHIIAPQDSNQLLIIMKSIYLQYGKNAESNLQQQINSLNERVLDYCVDNVMMNIEQHYAYLKDLTKEQEIMEKPQYVHIKGEKTLMPNHFF